MNNKDVVMVCVLFFMIGILFLGFAQSCADETYKDGQVDAINGKIRYELVVHPDSTRTWEEKKSK